MALDAHPNIEIRLYNPFRNRTGILRMVEMVQRFFSVNHRMHNKSWIADGRVAIVGGRNIGEEYFSARTDVNFQDLDLLVAGPRWSRPTGSSTTTGTAKPPFRYPRLPSIPTHNCACWYANRTMRRSGTCPPVPCARGRITPAAAPEPRAVALERCSTHRVGPADEAPQG